MLSHRVLAAAIVSQLQFGELGRGRAICAVVRILALAEVATGHHRAACFVIDMNTISTSSLRTI